MANPYATLGFWSGYDQQREAERKQKLADAALASAQADKAREQRRQDLADQRATHAANMQDEVYAAQLAKHKSDAEREGLIDMVKVLRDTKDPEAARVAFNLKGAHRLQPGDLTVDPNGDAFTMKDTDGKPVTMKISALASLIPAEKNHFRTVAPSASVLDERTGKIVATAPAKPMQPSGGGGGVGGPGKMPTPSELRLREKDANALIAKYLQAGYDNKTDQLVDTDPGKTERFQAMAPFIGRFTNKYQAKIGPNEIADAVYGAFSDVKPLADYQAEEEAKLSQSAGFFSLGKFAGDDSTATEAARAQAKVRRDAAIAAAEAKLGGAEAQLDARYAQILASPTASAYATPSAAPHGNIEIAKVSTIEEALRLPSGTRFVDPNGQVRIRP
jgi:hypothetical protein